MAYKKSILIALHDENLREQFSHIFNELGFNSVNKIEHIIRNEFLMTQNVLDKFREGDYGYLLMDANLGFPNSGNVNVSKGVYYNPLVQSRIKDKQLRFRAISGYKPAVEEARSKGMPADFNADFGFNLVAFVNSE